MKKKLTSRYIDTVTASGPKRLEVYDLMLPGFGIRVSVTEALSEENSEFMKRCVFAESDPNKS
jgi:hypothetical protein